jgi:hypothetical protein
LQPSRGNAKRECRDHERHRDTMMRVKFNETAERVFHGALLCARRSNSFAV